MRMRASNMRVYILLSKLYLLVSFVLFLKLSLCKMILVLSIYISILS